MKFLLSVLLLSLLLTSCEKSLENFDVIPVSGADTVWATANSAGLEIGQLQAQLARPATIDSFLLQSSTNLLTSNGLRVEIPANAFSGNPTGMAQAEINFLRTKGSLIRMAKPTLTNGTVLRTAGTFYINITKNGQLLTLQNGKTIRLAVTDSLQQTNLKPYTGEIPPASGFGVFNWRQNDSLSLTVTAGGYQLLSNRQQWLCVAAGLDTVSQKSRVVLSMPATYTNANTETFIIFKDAASVVQLTPVADKRIWLTEKIPGGKNVLYVTITKKENDYWLGIQEITTAFNQNIHVTPQKKSLQDINAFLDNL